MKFSRVVWIVLDSVGIGEMPDAAAYGDAGSDTLGNIARRRLLQLPNLTSLGLVNIKALARLQPEANPQAAHGRCALASWQRYDNGPLGDGRHRSRNAISGFPNGFPTL
ncbi:MAG: hypothetical protein WKF37_03705 [Bryobacteraceae bacterium]